MFKLCAFKRKKKEQTKSYVKCVLSKLYKANEHHSSFFFFYFNSKAKQGRLLFFRANRVISTYKLYYTLSDDQQCLYNKDNKFVGVSYLYPYE